MTQTLFLIKQFFVPTNMIVGEVKIILYGFEFIFNYIFCFIDLVFIFSLL